MSLIPLVMTGQLFCRTSLLCLIFSHDEIDTRHFGQESQRSDAVSFSVHHSQGGHDVDNVPLLVLTLITWLRWCLLNFSHVKLLFFFHCD